MGDTSYENFYGGGISSFDSNYSSGGAFLGNHDYKMSNNLGFPGSAQTANQLKETVNAIKQGVKAFEVTMVSPETADQIPIQNFDEMRALMKLTGVKPSVHAPIIDPSGFEQRAGYSEEHRKEAERKLFDTLKKASMLDRENNVPVVIHSTANVQGAEYRPGDESKGESRWNRVSLGVFNKQSKQIAGVIPEEREYALDMSAKDYANGGKLTKAEDMIAKENKSSWIKEKEHINYYTRIMDQEVESFNRQGLDKTGDIEDKEIQKSFLSNINRAQGLVETNQEQVNQLWNKLGKFGTDEQRGELKKISEKYADDVKKFDEKKKEAIDDEAKKRLIVEKAQFINSVYEDLNNITSGYSPHDKNKLETKESEEKWGAPKILVNAEEFAKEKAAETLGAVAWRGYKELGGEKAPMIAVENMYSGMAFSRAEDMEGLIKNSRKKFVENAKKNGMDERDASAAAEKLIGVTWDVGHLNLFKKSGFTDKDVIGETAKIAPLVKHVHLTDNFGYSDSHLAPGMGNVPFKEILKELERTGKLGDMRKIVEAPGFFQHFQKSPHSWTMAALGSPIYGGMMGPYWNQASGVSSGGGYMGGPMAYLPEKHFSTYGSGFSSLPAELGGQLPGTQSRFSGTPNT
jgi:sugar phosphate isomerase/epimerase